MQHVTTTKLRSHLSTYLSRVHIAKNRYLITGHGREVAALVSVADLMQIEEFDRKSIRQKELEYARLMDAWQRAKNHKSGDVLIR